MSTQKILLLFVAWFVAGPCTAQFTDNFSDGNFSVAPPWQGDVSRFVISSGRLKLQAPAINGAAFLSTPSQAIHEGTWEFKLQLDFTPSSSNYAKIYLVSDHADLQAALNGYFVKVGNTTREISLYAQTGATEQELIDGLDDRVNQAQVILTIRVVRTAEGRWELFTDVGNTGNLAKEGETIDLRHTESSWFGLQCTYSSTRSDKFWFDDFKVSGSVIPDTTPPAIVRIEALDPLHFSIRFTEPIQAASLTTNAIHIENLGNPVVVNLEPDQMTAVCALSSPLVNGRAYVIQIAGTSDEAGNAMLPATGQLLYFRPGIAQRKSVLITEFLADPTPQIGLPNAEFVELFNASNEPFDLVGWGLSDGSSIGKFPSAIFLPGEYKIVTASSSINLFDEPGVIGLTNFPSLNNSGDHIILTDNAGMMIDSINYVIDWYRDEDKQQGGWALELIDPRNPCGERENWAASEAASGGTPGRQNSISTAKPDLTPPELLSILPSDSGQLTLIFNEPLSELPGDVHISINPPIPISGIHLLRPAVRTIRLSFDAKLEKQRAYETRVEGVTDCSGNRIEPLSIIFGIPELADSLDLVLNEILFNPRPGGVDFIELFNDSKKFIDLGQLRLSNGTSSIDVPSMLLHPKQHVALTAEPQLLQLNYPSNQSRQLLKVLLPSLPDDEGVIKLFRREGKLLDSLQYDQSWHSPFIKNEEGVSLERIGVRAPTQQSDNWMSASSRAGFGTPGLPNSHERKTTGPPSSPIYVSPEVFAPSDPANDFVQIHYAFDQPGKVANVQVLNYQGLPVRHIANNDLLGTEGFFRWEGDRDDGARLPAGYYVVSFETFDAGGSVANYMTRVIIAGR
ncbi:MAG: lamin tail domain-containing protein [Cyclobacteriaceae bacterium]|nr:lamin tail domain-containing protein [Cyclobacteriaceae bacterium]